MSEKGVGSLEGLFINITLFDITDEGIFINI